jgi:hypothetical protein
MAFSFGKKEEPPKKMPWGNENPYRVFGVTEDAPYEDVEQAFKELVQENEGNEKYIMQLEMMKEKIFDDRYVNSKSHSAPCRIVPSENNESVKFVVLFSSICEIGLMRICLTRIFKCSEICPVCAD